MKQQIEIIELFRHRSTKYYLYNIVVSQSS